MAFRKLKIGLFLTLLLGMGAKAVPASQRSVRLATAMDLPVYVRGRFKNFFRAMFERQVDRAAQRGDFAEYAWDISECDSRAAHPLSHVKLGGLGVFG